MTATTSEAARRVADKRADVRTPLDKPSMPLEELPDLSPNGSGWTRPAARRPQVVIADQQLQWATGLQTKARAIYAGWMIEFGKDEELDEAFRALNADTQEIKHGNGKIVRHWTLATASLFVVCDGVQTASEMRGTQDRYGIAYAWRTLDGGKRQSVLRCRVFVQELLQAGYASPLRLTIKGTLTDDFLSCLLRHYPVLDEINIARQEQQQPALSVPYYAVSLQLGPGNEVQRGSGSQSRSIVPMEEKGTRDRPYIKAHWCKRAWVDAIEALADETIAWSVEESKKIAAGDVRTDADAQEDDYA